MARPKNGGGIAQRNFQMGAFDDANWLRKDLAVIERSCPSYMLRNQANKHRQIPVDP